MFFMGLFFLISGYFVPRVSGHIKWTEMVPINGTGEKQKEARGGPLEKKEGQES
jgi:hypothetical protein